jgi:hypothetical protein
VPFTSETAKEAGQKSKRGLSERTKILNELFDKEKAKTIFHELEKLALGGNMDAIKTYLAYCFGKPEAKIDITSDGEQIGPDLSRLSDEQLNQLRTIRSSIEYK